MKDLNKALFYILNFLVFSLCLIQVKTELILQKPEKSENIQDKFENFFQTIFQKETNKKDENTQKEEDNIFWESRKEVRNIKKLNIKDERYKTNPRKLEEESYIIVYYDKSADYPNGFRIGSSFNNLITKIKYNRTDYQYNSAFLVEAGTYLEIYINSGCTDFSGLFWSEVETNCESIVSIDLSHLTNQVITITRLFYHCGNFKALDISGLDFSNIQDMGGLALIGVNNIKYLNIYNTKFDEQISFIEYFKNNYYYPNGFIVCQSEDIITDERYEYKCCNYLTKFDKCESSIHIDIYFRNNVEYQTGFNINAESNHRNNVDYLVSGDYYIGLNESFNIILGCKLEIYFSSSITNLESFFDHNFDELTEKIVSIDFSNFNISGIVSLKNIFNGCSSLVSVNFSNFNTEFVINMDSMFNGCSSLNFVDLSKFNTQSVTNMKSMFNGCGKLKSLNIENFNTEIVNNMESMFNGCSELTSLNIANFNTHLVTNMQSFLNGCSKLKVLDISGLDITNIESGYNMFYNLQN